MGNNTEHFLKMTGTVPYGKHKEFEQTFKFVSNHMPPECLRFNLAVDFFNPDIYHFYSLWPTAESLAVFYRSQDFQLLEGAFKALGSVEKNITGELVEIKSFHSTDMDGKQSV